jgi:hypothetical protein
MWRIKSLLSEKQDYFLTSSWPDKNALILVMKEDKDNNKKKDNETLGPQEQGQ